MPLANQRARNLRRIEAVDAPRELLRVQAGGVDEHAGLDLERRVAADLQHEAVAARDRALERRADDERAAGVLEIAL